MKGDILKKQNIFVYCDVENIVNFSLRTWLKQFKAFLRKLEKLLVNQEFIRENVRIYVFVPNYTPVKDLETLESKGVLPILFDVVYGRKNCGDKRMIEYIEGQILGRSSDVISHVIIVSGDGGFIPIAQAIKRRRRCPVWIISKLNRLHPHWLAVASQCFIFSQSQISLHTQHKESNQA